MITFALVHLVQWNERVLTCVFSVCSDFRTEQYFGSPSDMASTAEHIRDRMKLVSLKRQQLRHPELVTTES